MKTCRNSELYLTLKLVGGEDIKKFVGEDSKLNKA